MRTVLLKENFFTSFLASRQSTDECSLLTIRKSLTSIFSMTCLPKEQILLDIVNVALYELSNLPEN